MLMQVFKFNYRQVTSRMGIEVSFVDFTVLENVQKALQPNTKVHITILILINRYIYSFDIV